MLLPRPIGCLTNTAIAGLRHSLLSVWPESSNRLLKQCRLLPLALVSPQRCKVPTICLSDRGLRVHTMNMS